MNKMTETSSVERSDVGVLVLASTYPRWRLDFEPAFVHDLSRHLVDKFKVHVLVPHTKGSLRCELLDGVSVHRYRYAPDYLETLCYEGGILEKLRQSPLRALLIPLFLVFQLLEAIKIVKRESIKIVHAHWIVPQGLVAAILKLIYGGRIKVLITSHGADLFALNNYFYFILKKFSLSKADCVSVVSVVMKEIIEKKYSVRNAHVISMGVDLKNLFVSRKEVNKAKDFIFVGRLVRKKGVDTLIYSFNKVVKKYPESTLRIVGSGPMEHELKSLAKMLHLDGNIEFVGAIQNRELPAMLQQTKIAVFPFVKTDSGDQEGFGLVLVEALGCECAVIASNLPATHDAMGGGECGVMVMPGDSCALGGEMLALLKDEKKRVMLADKGRKYALKRFDWSVIAEKYKKILDSI